MKMEERKTMWINFRKETMRELTHAKEQMRNAAKQMRIDRICGNNTEWWEDVLAFDVAYRDARSALYWIRRSDAHIRECITE